MVSTVLQFDDGGSEAGHELVASPLIQFILLKEVPTDEMAEIERSIV